MDRRRSNSSPLVALALAVAVSIGLLGGFFPHTDDGCQIEIHCLACRWALATTAVTAQLVISCVHLELAGARTPETPSLRVALPSKQPSSRGPPPCLS